DGVVLVLRVVLVVVVEGGAVHVHLVRRQPTLQSGPLGRGVDTELADELAAVVAVPPVVARLANALVGAAARAEGRAMPDLPGVPVAVESPVAGAPSLGRVLAPRAARPVRHPAVVRLHGVGQ